MLVSYNWIKEYLGDVAPTATAVVALLGAHAFEIESVVEKAGDTIFDVDVLPNRSSDCLCQRGIAREVATLTGLPLVHDPLTIAPALVTTDVISVTIEDEAACPRFTASLIEGIVVKESPPWLQDRLAALGQRSINNIVDATNYVMYAIGQPLHAYDAEKFPQVDGKWQFGVRRATAGEVVSLIAESGKTDDRDVVLKGTELLIVDNTSNTPIGLAGVKGGRFAGVSSATTKIIVEAAHFDPVLTRQTARGLGIVIDASKRFENEPSRELPLIAQSQINKLIIDIAGGESKGMIDIFLAKKLPPTVMVRQDRVNALLGLSLTKNEMTDLLLRAGITVVENKNVFACTGPFERTDLLIEADFIEEIGRMYGYDKVLAVVPEAVPLKEINERHYYSEKIRYSLINLGFSEVITSSFIKKDQIELFNALANDKRYVRSSLIENLAETLNKNSSFIDLLGMQAVRVFEIGTVFNKLATGIEERVMVGIGVRQAAHGYTQKDDQALAVIAEQLSDILNTKITLTPKQGLVEFDLTALLTTLPMPTTYEPVPVAAEIVYQAFSVFPAISRDVAMWVGGDVEVSVVSTVLEAAAGPLRVRTTHLDTFEKDGRISLAFRLVFQANDRTMTDDELTPVMVAVYDAVKKAGFEAR